LGAAATLPVPPLSNNVNGADTSISGTLKSASSQWFVLDVKGKDVWVPKPVVLLIQYP
jgi:hypothetical protein